MSFSYATTGSGPSAGGIGWFNFGNLTLSPGQIVPGLTGTLNDGTTITFDLSGQNPSGTARNFIASSTPTWGGAQFGNVGYNGILGNVALYSTFAFSPGTNGVTLSNIVVKDPMGNLVTNYTAIVADVESTNIAESWEFNTNGGVWNLFTSVGSINPPVLTGLGTTTATITGTALPGNPVDYLLSTQSPTQLVLNSTTTSFGGGRQAIVIGFAVTKVSVHKFIGARIDSDDQFVLNLAGTPNDQATTSGASVGLQSQVASVYGFAGNTYTIKEEMTPASINPLTAYMQTITAINISSGGSVAPTGTLPINFTPILGDIVDYYIVNAVPETFKKSVDKTFAQPGEVLTYTVVIDNPNAFAVNNVLFTDPVLPGTTYVGNLVVSAPYAGTTPASGLTITTIPANGTVTVSWQVMVKTGAPTLNPILNMGMVNVPGGTSGSTNVVSTQINYADLTSNGNFIKSVSAVNAQFGDTLTYTLTLKNTGNVAANNVIVTDSIPVGTTYVPGSVAASAPFTGDPLSKINLTNPIPSGGTVSITFKAKLGSIAPSINPVSNTASVKYAYTVDPAFPNRETAAGDSNTVTTKVSTANITIAKTTDKTIAYIGDVITYNLVVKNTGNVSADNVVITDAIPNGTVLVPGSLVVSESFSGSPSTAITLTNAVLAGQTVIISFQVKVTVMPVPNPIKNVATAAYAFTVSPNNPDGVMANSSSNAVNTIVFRNNFAQQISDLIESVALEQAALAAIANAEGAKIQKMVAMQGITTQQLLCLNKSVSDMMNSIALLENILKQKLAIVDCQISGEVC